MSKVWAVTQKVANIGELDGHYKDGFLAKILLLRGTKKQFQQKIIAEMTVKGVSVSMTNDLSSPIWQATKTTAIAKIVAKTFITPIKGKFQTTRADKLNCVLQGLGTSS